MGNAPPFDKNYGIFGAATASAVDAVSIGCGERGPAAPPGRRPADQRRVEDRMTKHCFGAGPGTWRILWLALGMATSGCGDADARQTAVGRAPDGGAQLPREADAASGIAVRGVTGQYDLGDYSVNGEVVNGLDAPIYDVELEVAYLGAGGAVLARDEAASVLSRVEPGAAVPFTKMHYGAPEGIQDHAVTVKRFSRQARLDYRPLAITGVRSRAGITGAVVTGQARNDAGVPLTSVKLVTSFRDAAGRVTGVYFDYPVTGAMAPDQTVNFTVETMDESVAGDSASVQGEGHAGPRP